ncbi:hypothetical protein ABFS82_05G048700 [Erythranthe guttata]
MALRSGGRKLSFDILAISQYDDVVAATSLSRSNSDPHGDGASSPTRRKKKKRRSRKGKTLLDSSAVSEISAIDGDVSYSCTTSTVTEAAVVPPDLDGESSFAVTLPLVFGELRQRNVGSMANGGGSAEMMMVSEESGCSKKDDNVKEEIAEKQSGGEEIDSDQKAELSGRKLEKEGTLDWKKLMAEDPNYTLPVEKSPMKYFMDEMYAGNSLRSTTTLGNDKERERVYDTIFRLPWRCELLINFGFFVCFDSFLSLLTIMPTRIIMTFWRLLRTRQLKRPSSAELSDYGCFVVLVAGVTLLQQADISLIYHMIRGQGIIKLYVVYNVLEIFDKLCQSFGGDVMQSLFNSADGLANCSQENVQFWLWRFFSDEVLAVVSSNILFIIMHFYLLIFELSFISLALV